MVFLLLSGLGIILKIGWVEFNMKSSDYKFEQYKILVNSAEDNSNKRITQNNIYLTLNLAFLSYIISSKSDITYTILTSIIGITICVIWFLTISNYCKRNKVKFNIINEIENDFSDLYKEEWKRISILTSLSTYEKLISIVFIIIYIVIPIMNFIK